MDEDGTRWIIRYLKDDGWHWLKTEVLRPFDVSCWSEVMVYNLQKRIIRAYAIMRILPNGKLSHTAIDRWMIEKEYY